MITKAREKWLSVGLELLARDGPSALTIERLCQATGRTKGSFYHHFASTRAFEREVTAHWKQSHTQNLIDLTQGSDAAASLTKLRELTRQLDFDQELAIRAWGANDPEVGQAVVEVDQARIAYLEALFQGLGYSQERARATAWIEYALLIGMAHLRPSLPSAQRRSALNHLERRLHHD